jgi:CRISPR/Cas system-associated exonuclease Cas4 (RecB family)
VTWSFSDSRTFRVCQRKWYFDEVVASAVAKKEPIRREVYLLSKLQGLSSWRGNLVDYVISEHIIEGLSNHRQLSLGEALSISRDLFDQQVKFARAHRLREPGIKVSDHKGEFAAWHAVEYGDGVSEDALETSWEEIKLSITNLYQMSDLFEILANSAKLIRQRSLTFSIEDFTVRATPDLIAFRRAQPPLIIDWKTYVNDSQDHRLQLACYALALTSCKPHIDFPASLLQVNVSDIDLTEVQLVTKKQRHYKISKEDCVEVENFILESAMNMQSAVAGLSGGMTQLDNLPVARSPMACKYCPFQSVCWKE